jgi:hypothetical protein
LRAFSAGEPVPGDERKVGNPHQGGSDPHHAVGANADSQVVLVEIRLDQVHEFASQSRLLEPYRFLHQSAVNQLAETVLSFLRFNDILLGGSAGRGVKPDPLQRNPTQPFPQVSQGLDVGRSDRRLRHNSFLADCDNSKHLFTILTPRSFMGKRRRAKANARQGTTALGRLVRTQEDRPIVDGNDPRCAFPGIDQASRPDHPVLE